MTETSSTNSNLLSTDLRTRVRESRTSQGISQKSLADTMTNLGHPWHQTTVAKVETGARPVHVDEAFSLAAALAVDTGWLLGLSAPRTWGLKYAYVCLLCDFVSRHRVDIKLHVENVHQAVSA